MIAERSKAIAFFRSGCPSKLRWPPDGALTGPALGFAGIAVVEIQIALHAQGLDSGYSKSSLTPLPSVEPPHKNAGNVFSPNGRFQNGANVWSCLSSKVLFQQTPPRKWRSWPLAIVCTVLDIRHGLPQSKTPTISQIITGAHKPPLSRPVASACAAFPVIVEQSAGRQFSQARHELPPGRFMNKGPLRFSFQYV